MSFQSEAQNHIYSHKVVFSSKVELYQIFFKTPNLPSELWLQHCLIFQRVINCVSEKVTLLTRSIQAKHCQPQWVYTYSILEWKLPLALVQLAEADHTYRKLPQDRSQQRAKPSVSQLLWLCLTAVSVCSRCQPASTKKTFTLNFRFDQWFYTCTFYV